MPVSLGPAYRTPLININSGPTAAAWQRPADWLPKETVTATDNKIAMLIGVRDTGDLVHVAFTITTSAGGNTVAVDWGDGDTTPTGTSGTVISHAYDIADLAGTQTSDGFYQAMCVITPVSGDITAIDLAGVPSGWSGMFSNPQLEIIVGAPSCTSFSLSNGFNAAGACRLLRNLEVRRLNISTLANKFLDHHGLQNVIFDCTNVTSLSGTFRYSFPTTVELTNYSGVENLNSAFYGSKVLALDLSNSSGLTSYSDGQNDCRSIISLVADFSNVTTCSGAFTRNYNLQRVVLSGVKVDVNVTNCGLNAAAIEEFCANAGVPAVAATFTTVGCPGALTASYAALHANWTVVSS